MTTALIFSIQKFSIHDGPGIRTTIFFKGCPLTCQWCHNPESQSYQKEMFHHAERCISCGRCASSCRQQAIHKGADGLHYDEQQCTHCEVCTESCYHNVWEIVGKEYTVPELMIEIEKDRPFYEQSGGGVTLSGGEVMTQIEFVQELIQSCKEQGISVAVDTCGHAPWENFMRMIENVDFFLYDIKFMDAALHQKYTGVDNTLILENLKRLSNHGATINLRLPLLAGINTEDHHIQQVLNFIRDLNIHSVNLLPYHDLATGKYQKMHKQYAAEIFLKPSDEQMTEIQEMFRLRNYEIKIGG